jgi:cobalt/nickel transport system permease protein
VQIRFTPPPAVASPLASLDARWRLALLFAVIVASAVVRSLTAAALALLFSLVLAALARVPVRWYLSRLSVVAGLLALFVVPVPLLGGSFVTAGVILCKSLALFTLGCVLLVSASVETTLKAAHALYVPGLLVHLVLLSYRYLFVLADELARLRVALRTRGFRNRPDLRSWRTVGAASGTLLVRGHDRAERVAAAMRCRGFDGRFRSLDAFSTKGSDVVAFVLTLALAAALVTLDVLLRE